MIPSRTQRAACLLASAVLADLHQEPRPPQGKALGQWLLLRAATHATDSDLRSLDRRVGTYASAWAGSYLLRFAASSELTVLRPDRHLLEADLPVADRHRIRTLQALLVEMWPGSVGGSHPLDVRLVRRAPDGAVTIDELTSAHRANAVGQDGFARTALAAHFALGKTVPGFAGVRLLAPRVPLASQHVTAPGLAHPLGGCPSCVPTARRFAGNPAPSHAKDLLA